MRNQYAKILKTFFHEKLYRRTVAQYSYDGYRLSRMTDTESNYALAFTYEHGKIKHFQELAGSDTGAQVAVTYPNHSQTTYRDYGKDRIFLLRQAAQTMRYDGVGNVTSATLSGNGIQTITTSASYDTNGNRLVSVTDATGATVSYAYGDANSQMMGLPTSVTDPKGTVTETAYDNFRPCQSDFC